MTPQQLSLDAASVTRGLGVTACLLIFSSMGIMLVAHFVGHESVYWLVQLFYLNHETNIPSGFSTFLLLFASVLIALIAVLKKKHGERFVWHWAILSCGFLVMAVDEAWSFHERLGGPVRKLAGEETIGIFRFVWVIPGIAAVLVLALFFLNFLLHLPAKTRSAFLIAAALYLGGALGVETIGGHFADMGFHNLTYSMIVTVEESLEMAGAILFIQALLMYIADNHTEVHFRFENAPEKVGGDMV